MKLCLNMIVRNEAARIERCLRSSKDYISTWSILDTGSTDDTCEIIERLYKEWGIPGELHHGTFENFEQARNLALDYARKSPHYWDFVLLYDADMELVVTDHENFLKLDYAAPSYDMVQRSGSLRYLNRRLINRTATGNYVGVTHEYLDVPAYGLVVAGYFIDHADGANRPDKFKRDIALLLGAIEKKPQDARSWFYLAQSYRDAGEHDKAIEAYQRRIELGGWDEEVWFSRYSIANCYKAKEDFAAYREHMLQAHQMRPSRAEPLYELANYYRTIDKTAIACIYAEAGMDIPRSRDALFVQEYAYTTGCKEEFAICGFYQPHKRARAFTACDQLALDKDGTPHSREQARSNLFHYILPLRDIAPSFKAHPIQFVPSDGFVPMNPSLAQVLGDKLACIVRTVNYNITPDGRYEIRAGDGSINDSNPIETRNYLLRLQADLSVHDVTPIKGVLPPPKYKLVRGWEDMRLFEYQHAMWISANVRESNEHGWCEQHVGRLVAHEDHYGVEEQATIYPDRPDRQHEKNWMPWIHSEELTFMYRMGQSINRDGKLTKLPCEYEAQHISGGTQVIPYAAGMFIAVVHEARIRPDNNTRYYHHRFVIFGPDGGVTQVSKPFVFHDKQIEFAAGIAQFDQQLFISYGVRDREAWIASISLDDVMRLF